MVVVEPEPLPLDCQVVSCYYAKDPLIGNLPVIVFHGPSTTTNSTLNSSRIQAHIFSLAGYQVFPRLTIAPTSPLYSAVHLLPEEQQGDEIARGLAISLLKYFSEIPNAVRQCILDLVTVGRPDEKAPPMLDGAHAADLASRMEKLENGSHIATHLLTALAHKSLSWTDVDVILPRDSVAKVVTPDSLADLEEKSAFVDDGRPLIDYGKFTEIVELFGSPSFLPTSRIRRAPSRPTASSKSRTLNQNQIQSIQRDMQELLETEKNYVMKMYDLANSVAAEYIRNAGTDSLGLGSESEKAMKQLFPPSLNEIVKLNDEFLSCLIKLMENDDGQTEANAGGNHAKWITERDPTGADAFAKILLEFTPRFRQPYRDYARASDQFPSILNELLRDSASGIARFLHQTGEQRLRAWLIEPVQRLPRYTLLIDNIVNQLPADHPAMSRLLKAKDTIVEICALDEEDEDDKSKPLKHLKALVHKWPENLAPTGRLLTAVDVIELKAPYSADVRVKDEPQSMLILFPNYLLILRKAIGAPLSARGLLAEVDRPGLATRNVQATGIAGAQAYPLTLAYAFKLSETRLTESSEGRIICLASVQKAINDKYNPESSTTTTRVYALLGSYEGKAARFNEEIARARVEYRFPEKMREDERWGLRSISPYNHDSLGIVSAVFARDLETDKDKRRVLHGRVRVVIQDVNEHVENTAWEDEDPDVEITAKVSLMGHSKYRLEFRGFDENSSLDNIKADDFVNVFLKRCKSNLSFLYVI
jgi:hypothetical protein